VGTVGIRRALQIFLAEDSFSAQQAYDWGLVAKIVPAAELKAATQTFAERLAQNPSAAIGGTKSLVYQAAVTPTKQQLDAEEEKIIDCMHTDEFRVAVKRFPARGSRASPLSPVVPAHAGTPGVSAFALIAAPCRLVLALEQRPSTTTCARGYGSPPSRGRRWFCCEQNHGQIYPVPAGDLKQPTDSGITCFGSHSTTFGK